MKIRSLWLLLFLLLAFAVALGVKVTKPPQLSTIVPYVRPQIVSFAASARQVNRGEPVTLSWTTTGTTQVSIESRPQLNPGSLGEKKTGLPPWGTMTVKPEEDTVYILECDAPKGVAVVSARVQVQVNPTTLTRGDAK